MKTPSGKFKVIILAVIAIVSVVILQACATELWNGKKMTLKIGKDKDTFVEFVQPGGKEKFDKVLRRLPNEQYSIRYKEREGADVIDPYHPPRISLKTDKVTTSELAKNEPPGDPHITQKVTTNSLTDIKDILNSLKSP
jgi:hypothetical protein